MAENAALKLVKESEEIKSRLALTEEFGLVQAPLRATVSEIVEESGVAKEELKRGQGLVRAILGYVVANNYDQASQSIKDYVTARHDYPDFEERVERYQKHSVELIEAIRTKRGLTSTSGLSNAKQHEMRERVRRHFDELKVTLQKIEKVHVEVQLEDVRSTVWFVRAVSVSVGVIFSILFLKVLFSGNIVSMFYVLQGFTYSLVDSIFNLF